MQTVAPTATPEETPSVPTPAPNRGGGRGLAIAGLVLAGIAVVIGLVLAVVLVTKDDKAGNASAANTEASVADVPPPAPSPAPSPAPAPAAAPVGREALPTDVNGYDDYLSAVEEDALNSFYTDNNLPPMDTRALMAVVHNGCEMARTSTTQDEFWKKASDRMAFTESSLGAEGAAKLASTYAIGASMSCQQELDRLGIPSWR